MIGVFRATVCTRPRTTPSSHRRAEAPLPSRRPGLRLTVTDRELNPAHASAMKMAPPPLRQSEFQFASSAWACAGVWLSKILSKQVPTMWSYPSPREYRRMPEGRSCAFALRLA